MTSKVQINVGVNFQAEGKQFEQYAQNLQKTIEDIKKSSGNKNAFSETEKTLKDVTQQYEKLSKYKLNSENTVQYSREVDKLKQSLQSLDASFKVENQSLGAQAQKYKENIESAKTRREGMEEEIKLIKEKKAQDRTNDERHKLASYNALGGVITKNEKALAKLETQTNQQAQAQQQLNGIEETGAQVLEGASKATTQLTQAEEDANKQNTINAIKKKIEYYTSLAFSIRIVRDQFRKARETFQEVDKSITSISMVSGISRDTLWGNIGEYNKLAQELGTTTDKVLEASQLYYQQGRNTIEVVELTRESLTLAAIAGLETADATNYLTAAVNGYKMEASEAGEVTDVWAQLAAKNAVSVKELAVSISKVASIAQSAGMDIQSTSAFLTQMIATTREAPENLGTALKTIIARFQELKTSSEALEDGVDANKVEKALRTVGIELRDTTGQFRDFDDVILELSSKWDSLDRNTQRYIATIAAGSRQQSRFIALVSDYDGLVEIMDQAANAEGAAGEQFEVYSSGMEAALNRVKSAWQGFYLSWENGHNIITGVLNSITGLLNGMSKIGILPTAAIVAFTVAMAKMGFAMLTTGIQAKDYFHSLTAVQIVTNLTSKTTQNKAKLQLKAALAAKQEASATGQLRQEEIAELAVKAKKLGLMNEEEVERIKNIALEKGEKVAIDELTASTNLLNASNPLGLITLVVSALAIIIPLLTTIGKKTEKLKEQISSLNEASTTARQNSKTALEYADSLEAAVKAGEDLTDIRQQIIDSFGYEIGEVDVATGSWDELCEALRNYSKEQDKIAAGSRYGAALTNAELKKTEQKKSIQEEEPLPEDYGWTETNLWEGNEEGFKEFQAANEKYIQQLKEAENQTISFATAQQTAQSYLGDDATTQEVNNFALALQQYKDELLEWDEENQEFILNGEKTKAEIDELTRTYGDLTKLNVDQLRGITGYSEGTQQIVDSLIKQYTDAEAILNTQLTAIFGDGIPTEVTSKLNEDLTKAFASSFNSLGDNEELQESFNEIIGQILSNPDIEPSAELFEKIASVVKDGTNGLEEYYETLIKVGADGKLEVGSLANIIGGQLDEVNEAFLQGKKVVDDYFDELDLLQKGTQSMSWQEMSDWINQVSQDYQRLGYDTQAAAEAALWNNVVTEGGNSVKQDSTTILDDMTTALTANTEQEKANAISKIDTAIADVQKAKQEIDDHIATTEAVITSLKARMTSESTATDVEIDMANQTIQANNDILTSVNDIGAVAGDVPVAASIAATSANNRAVSALISRLEDSLGTLKDARAVLDAREAKLTAFRGYLSAPRSASSSNSGGGGGAAKEVKEVDEKLKELEKTLDEAKEKAKLAGDAAKAAADKAKKSIDDVKLGLDALKESLENESDLLEDQIDDIARLEKLRLEALKEEAEEREKAIEEAAEQRQKDYDDQLENLQRQQEAIKQAYDFRINAIDDAIDALDDEAEAEDRLLKLQKARDEYERARSQKTRLVLTQGAGWIFKTDTSAVNEARSNLRNAERDEQKAQLEDLKKAYETARDNELAPYENLEKGNLYLEDIKGRVEEILAKVPDYENVNVDTLLQLSEENKANTEAQVSTLNDLKDTNDAQAKTEEEILKNIDLFKESIDQRLDKLDWDWQDWQDDAIKQGFKNDTAGLDANELMDYGNVVLQDVDNTLENEIKPKLQRLDDIHNRLDEIEKTVKALEKAAEYIGLTTEQIDERNAIIGKFSEFSYRDINELNNEVPWNQIADDIELSRITAEASEKAAAEEQAAQDALDAYKKSKEEGEQSVAAAQGAVNGNGVGTAIAKGYQSGGSPSNVSADAAQAMREKMAAIEEMENQLKERDAAIKLQHDFEKMRLAMADVYAAANITGENGVTTNVTPTINEPMMALSASSLNNAREALNYYTINIKTSATTIKDNITEAMRRMQLSNYSTNSIT